MRSDRFLRTVLWLDAFLSASAVVLAVLAVPVLMFVPVPADARAALGPALFGLAAVLAGCGAVYSATIMLRLKNGHPLLPPDLRLPWPGAESARHQATSSPSAR